MPENPFLEDRGQKLAMLLMSLGGGISNAAASGQGGFAGIGPGISNFANSLGAAQQQKQAADLRRYQLGLQERELKSKEDERKQKAVGMNVVAGMLAPGGTDPSAVPGMSTPPTKPRMGPDSYDTRTAGLEGGSRNGGMVFNELGSGAFGPYQFMPGTWADVRTNNPDLNLPADITQASREQHDAAHERFKAANARVLKAAGIEPTPQNLYLAHRFGAGGATTMLRAGDDKLLADVLPVDWQRQNPDMRGQTVGGFKRLAGERMQGVGVPYEANGETTPYALSPTALPNFEGMPGPMAPAPGALQPGQAPSFTAPVMPQPQMPAQAPQPGPAQAPQATVTPVSDGAPSPQPPQVPMPMLPAQIGRELAAAVQSGAMTPEAALSRKQQIINDLWTRNQTAATQAWQNQWEAYKFDRGQKAEQKRHERDFEEKERTRGDTRTAAEVKRGDEQKKLLTADEDKLRDDFDKAPAVKAYRTVVPMLESAKDAQTRPTRAADLNLVYAFAKLMDPESVVRESETAGVVATASVADRLSGYIGQLNGQPMLTPAVRQKLIDELDSRFNSLKTSYEAHEEAYKGISDRRGLNFDNIRIPVRNGQSARRDDYAVNAPTNEELKSKQDGPKPPPIRIDMSGKRK